MHFTATKKILPPEKHKIIRYLEDCYRQQVVNNALPQPICFTTHDNTMEYTFMIPAELRAFIEGLKFNDTLNERAQKCASTSIRRLTKMRS